MSGFLESAAPPILSNLSTMTIQIFQATSLFQINYKVNFRKQTSHTTYSQGDGSAIYL